MRKVVQKIYNKICRRRVERALPGIVTELATCSKGSDTTGTQWITLWFAVSGILKQKPAHILESGAGSSTLVLAAAGHRLKRENPDYDGRITSMESVKEWYDIASTNLPEKYRDVVVIVLGPREKFEMGMFRGFVHSNIPKNDYSFVLVDAPKFWDENGIAFCADMFKVMDLSSVPVIHGVVDGRVSSVLVLQILYGAGVSRYYHSLFAASFSIPRIDFRDTALNTPKDFRCSPFGRLSFSKFRR